MSPQKCLFQFIIATAILTGSSVGASGIAQASPQGQAASGDLLQWADQVWLSAQDGDESKLDGLLANVPEGLSESAVARLRCTIESRKAHQIARARQDAEQAQKVSAETDAAFVSGDLVKGGLKLHELKLVLPSTDWCQLIGTEKVAGYMTQLCAAADAAAAAHDLLLEQEFVFRLRGLTEDCGQTEAFKKHDDRFDALNKQLTLVSRFAPRSMHRMRAAMAKRLTPEEAKETELDPQFEDDWKESVEGIGQTMLTAAMGHLANEHVTGSGWKPLIEGGIASVKLLVSTPGLAESFEKLDDPAKVRRMLQTLDEEAAGVAKRPEREFGKGYFRATISNLLKANRETVDLPDEVLLHQFGEGASEALSEDFGDEYTQIIWPADLRRFRQQIEGDFVGVGILIRPNDKHEIIVVNPLEGSPAARGGVRPGDQITGVDGQSTSGWTTSRAVDKITGPQGEEVTLSVKRKAVDGDSTLDLPLVRERIKLRSVNGWWKDKLDAKGMPVWNWFIDEPAGIGYVRLTSFSDDSYDDFMGAIAQMRRQHKLNGLILDLRGNPGGLLKSAVGFTNLFVERGPIVSVEDLSGKVVARNDAEPRHAPLAEMPLVVLVNQGSASASEIVSGSLQAHDAAVILGERSFGKGSVQTVQSVMAEGQEAGIKVTTQYYRLPAEDGSLAGRLVHKKPGSQDWGVNPDLVVDVTPMQSDEAVSLRLIADSIFDHNANTVTVDLRPDVCTLTREGVDPQLEMALLLLQARTLKVIEAEKIAENRARGATRRSDG